MELVRSIHERWEHGDYGSAEWAHANIEYVIVDGPTPGSWTGVHAMAETWHNIVGSWEGHRVEAVEYRELDSERVFVVNRFHGRGRASGLELDAMSGRTASVFHVRDGKVTRLVQYWDHERALAEQGLS